MGRYLLLVVSHIIHSINQLYTSSSPTPSLTIVIHFIFIYKDFLMEQVALLRMHSPAPIIFTVRSKCQGGTFSCVFVMMNIPEVAGMDSISRCYDLHKTYMFCLDKQINNLLPESILPIFFFQKYI